MELLIRGTVQGVGFRPFVFNLASRLSISGSVANTSRGVIITAVSNEDSLSAFIKALCDEAPPLAQIRSIEQTDLTEPIDTGEFSILHSSATGGAAATIPPDIAICDDCFNELNSLQDKRYHYPFINCTNCGPRFTIVEHIPYDRPMTSMKVFPMCDTCRSEYENPADRRFHAQPNACPECGPQVSWHDQQGKRLECDDPINEAVEALNNGKVIALRGLGGFHLAVNALSHNAITNLRTRKNRPYKPLAVMVAEVETARKYAKLTEADEKLLLSPQHPIVLAPKSEAFDLPDILAPNVADIGIMLPYTPLHHLFFLYENCPDVLVMTSGNISGIPICTDNDDAVEKLGRLVDNFLLHNREIVTRVDDSVARTINDIPRLYRRSRGYVPSPIVVPWQLPELIACGGGLKSTFSLSRGTTIFPSQHIGDLANLESYDFYIESIAHLQDVFEIKPEAVACDLHPDYMSSRYAASLDLPLYKVQHHHAHAVAVMAEHHIEEPVLALIMDGTGYGTDGTIWGGEILEAHLTHFNRLGHLSTFQLPGGDIAAYQPWRVAASLLHNLGMQQNKFPASLSAIDNNKLMPVLSMIDNNFNCPVTSSCGRLFDGVSSLLGIQHINSYEGQAAIELETLAWKAATQSWTNELNLYMNKNNTHYLYYKNGKWEISCSEFVKVIIDLIKNDIAVEDIALFFHFLIIDQFTTLIRQLADQTGISKVVLSGGCFQNSLLLQGCIHALTVKGLEPLTAASIPANDGGISVGQAVIGGLSHVYSTTNAGNQG